MLKKIGFSAKDAGVVLPDGSIIGACERSVGYRFVHGEKADYPDRPLILDIGKAIEHMRFKQHLENGDLLRFNDSLHNIVITGQIDEITLPFVSEMDMVLTGNNLLDTGISIPESEMGQIAVGEIKSVSYHNYKYRTKTPSEEHILQVAVYCMLTTIPYGIIEYIDRNDGLETWYMVEVIDDIIRWKQIYNKTIGIVELPWIDTEITQGRIIERFVYFENKLRSNQPLDKRDYSIDYGKEKIRKLAAEGKLNKSEMKQLKTHGIVMKGDYQCKYCPFKDTCWGL